MGPAIAPDKVAIYIRWSTEDQGLGTTLAVQRDGCTHFLLSQGWVPQDDLIFVDEGYSGGSMDRPGLTRLREAVQVERVQCVVVFKLDRLSRSVVDMVKLVIDEWGDRCSLKSAREPIDTTTPAGKMFFYTLTSFAEWERSVIRERTFAGKTKRAQAGRNPGFRPPYGYVAAPEHRFAPLDTEAAVVRRIFAEYVAGAGTAALATELNRTGPPFRGGRPWHQQTIYRILRNPIYAGDFHWGVRRYNPHHGCRPGEVWWPRNDSPLVVVADAVPPLVSRSLYEAAQRARSSRPTPRRGQSGRQFTSPFLLAGLLRCSDCGGALAGRRRSGSPSVRYYFCARRQTGRGDACSAAYIRADLVETPVIDRLMSHYGAAVKPLIRQALQEAEAAKGLDPLAATLEAAKRELAAAERRLIRLQADYLAERMSIAEYRTLSRPITEVRKAAVATVKRLTKALCSRSAAAEAYPNIDHWLDGQDGWDRLDQPVRRSVLRHLIHQLSAGYSSPTLLQISVVWRTGAP